MCCDTSQSFLYSSLLWNINVKQISFLLAISRVNSPNWDVIGGFQNVFRVIGGFLQACSINCSWSNHIIRTFHEAQNKFKIKGYKIISFKFKVIFVGPHKKYQTHKTIPVVIKNDKSKLCGCSILSGTCTLREVIWSSSRLSWPASVCSLRYLEVKYKRNSSAT
jgi:hypothetical protein